MATSWNPSINSTVSALAINGSTVYVGGNFTTVNDLTLRNSLAAVDLTSGIATSWDPYINSAAYVLVISGPNLFLGGGYGQINIGTISKARTNFSVLNLTTGEAL